MYVDPTGHFLISTAVAVDFWIGLGIGAIAGAASATIFLYGSGIAAASTFYAYELWVLLEKGIERVIEYVF